MYEKLVREILGLDDPNMEPKPAFRRKTMDEILEGKGIPRGGAASLTPILEPGSVAAMNAEADATAAAANANPPGFTPQPGISATPPFSLPTKPLRTRLFSTPEDWSFQASPPQKLFGSRTPRERAMDRLNAASPGLWNTPAPVAQEPVQPPSPSAWKLFRNVARSPYEGLEEGLLDEVIDDQRQERIQPQPFTQPEGEFNKSINRWIGPIGARLFKRFEEIADAMGDPDGAVYQAERAGRMEQLFTDNQRRVRSRDDVKNWEDWLDLRESQAGSVAPRIATGATGLAFPPIRPITTTMSIADWANRLFPSDHDMPEDLP